MAGATEEEGWPEVSVLAPSGASEALERWLLAAGALAVTLVDAREDDDIAHAVLEPAPGEIRLWERVALVGLFAREGDDAALAEALALAALSEDLPGGLPDYRLSRLADTVWERVWMRDFTPMRFGPRLLLCPSHVEPEVDDGTVTLRLDPGLAFGSGTHPTTAQCLEWLARDTARERSPFAGRRLIDYGCGSGVLAIAAALLGAREVVATDVDPQALLATRANARANGVDGRVRTLAPEALSPEPVDALLANILFEPLVGLADTIARLVRPGGSLVLSGVLESQSEALRLRYTPAFDFAPERSRDGWVLLEATRRSNA